MRADLRHHDGLFSPTFQRRTDKFLAETLVIFPRVVEEVDSMVECFGDHVVDIFLNANGAQMISTHSQDRHLKSS